ncbi:hypothetical protein BC937DRAFT_93153 [Endogone sp. FLAS-F59071]|nr:hypothetical protein BC937DRAFT_93153 [Endogone sp. FLAS-F59071]|eukprot:RUS14924.1 hypothetical protein BC937DRAFT_93153 [Endogone sp. FLAS-F59071]
MLVLNSLSGGIPGCPNTGTPYCPKCSLNLIAAAQKSANLIVLKHLAIIRPVCTSLHMTINSIQKVINTSIWMVLRPLHKDKLLKGVK